MTQSEQLIATLWFLAMVGIMGLVVGSFLNVVVERVPANISVVRPRSRCSECNGEISAKDNIPIVSWLVLRGQCRNCLAPISIQYPLVEFLTGLVWLLLGWWSLVTAPAGLPANPLLPLVLVLSSALIALFIIDIRWHRLPNAIVYLLYPVTAVGLVADLTLGGAWAQFPSLALGALWGALLWLGVIGFIWFGSRGKAMGLGDVKLAPILGAVLGWQGFSSAGVGLFMAFIFGAIVGIALIGARRSHARSTIAFGPYLILGFFFGLVLGPSVWEAYQGLIGLAS